MPNDSARSKQAPLKARYKEDAKAAVHTLRASGRVNQDALTFALDTGKPGIPAGLHPASGGDGSDACSGDMLLEALASCAGVTLAAVALFAAIVSCWPVVFGERSFVAPANGAPGR